MTAQLTKVKKGVQQVREGAAGGGECGPFDWGYAEFKTPVGWETKREANFKLAGTSVKEKIFQWFLNDH